MPNIFKTYLFDRIKSSDYRGIHLSQHNRLPFDKVTDILTTIYSIAADQRFDLHIGDWKGVKQANCDTYYKIVAQINQKIGQSTVNSLKKNIFPDLQRMGFLERFDKDVPILGDKKANITAAKLSNLAIDYVSTNSDKKRYKSYTEATERLLEPIVDWLFALLYKEFDSISVWEFMCILSDTRIDIKTKENLIRASRQLSSLEHIALRQDVQKLCDDLSAIAKNKSEKRDFGNWYNETLQIFNLLNQTIYFKTFRKTVLMLALSQEALEFRAIRSESAKIKALQWHEIQVKNSGYQLHHIVPLDYATCNKDLDLIDNHKNLIYITEAAHKKIPTKNNLFVELRSKNGKIYLANPIGNKEFDITNDVICKAIHMAEMIDYNKKILQSSIHNIITP